MGRRFFDYDYKQKKLLTEHFEANVYASGKNRKRRLIEFAGGVAKAWGANYYDAREVDTSYRHDQFFAETPSYESCPIDTPVGKVLRWNISAIKIDGLSDKDLEVQVQVGSGHIEIVHNCSWGSVDHVLDIWKRVSSGLKYQVYYRFYCYIDKELKAKDFYKRLASFIFTAKKKFGKGETIKLDFWNEKEEEHEEREIDFERKNFLDKLKETTLSLKNLEEIEILPEMRNRGFVVIPSPLRRCKVPSLSCKVIFDDESPEDSRLSCEGISKKDLLGLTNLWKKTFGVGGK